MMADFSVKDGQFWLGDQPLFIHAGEFHYFRTPAEDWRHRLGLLQQAGFNTVSAYIPWLWHQPQPHLTDLDGHTHALRDLAGFLDLATEMGLYIIARPGPYIMAETINEGVPPWVFEQYPQCAFVSLDGTVQNIASYLHPDFLRCVEGWYEAVFSVLTPRQITHGGRILLVQLDNEMGMIHWVRNIIDTNPDTLTRFADWLHAAYGDSLSRRYPAAQDALVGWISSQLLQTGADSRALVEDYRRFFRQYLRTYTVHLWDRARAHGLTVPPVINIHGFSHGSGKTFPIGLSQLVEVMALDGMVSATDVYPIQIGEGSYHHLLLVNEMTKALQDARQPLFSIEFQCGGFQDHSSAQASLFALHSRLSISVGMRAINHYLFFDGENDPVLSPIRRHDWGHPVRKDGSLRQFYPHYGRLSRTLAAYGRALVMAQPVTVTTIGFQIDAFMTEVSTPATQLGTDILTHQREAILFDFIARGLALTHRPFNAVELARGTLDVAQTPTLWVMIDRQCDANVQQQLVDYVRAGGRLVLAGRLCDETFDHEPCTVLREALGIEQVTADAPFTPAFIDAFGYQEIPVMFCERYAGRFDEVFATASQDGQPVGFVQTVGNGRVVMLGAAVPTGTLDDLDIVEQVARLIGCAPQFTMDTWADVRLSDGTAGRFLFVSNYQDDPIATRIIDRGVPLFAGHAVMLPARRGAILPLDWTVREGITIHFCTAEVTDVIADADRVLLKLAGEAVAQVSLNGYVPEAGTQAQHLGDGRWTITSGGGTLLFLRGASTGAHA